jgi:hypothetical protein
LHHPLSGDVGPTVLFNHLHGLGVGDFAGDDQNPPHQTRAKLPNGRDHFSSGHLRAPEIQKDGVKALLLDHCQRLAGIVGDVAFASQSCQQNVEDVADGGFILDDQNIAKLVAIVQSILSEVALKQLRLLAQTPFQRLSPPSRFNEH